MEARIDAKSDVHCKKVMEIMTNFYTIGDIHYGHISFVTHRTEKP